MYTQASNVYDVTITIFPIIYTHVYLFFTYCVDRPYIAHTSFYELETCVTKSCLKFQNHILL